MTVNMSAGRQALVKRPGRTIDTAGVLTRTFANVGARDAYGVDATVARNGTRLSGFVSTSGFRQVSSWAGLPAGLNASGIGWAVRTNASFHTSREKFTANDPRFSQVSVRRSVIRGVILSATWTFGHSPRRGRDDLIGNDTGAP